MSKNLFMNVVSETIKYFELLQDIPIGVTSSIEELKSSVDSDLPNDGEDPEIALNKLISSVKKGLIHSQNPRYFGFVIGGSTPTSIAADWLTSVWDQNAQVFDTSPAASIIEDIVANWILELLKLPKELSVGFLTGAQMANFTALNVARNAMLEKHGWDIELNGLQGSPNFNILVGESCHGTIHSAIRMMGLGKKNIKSISSDFQGRINIDSLKNELNNCSGPTIICAQAGNVNTGCFDSFEEIIPLAKKHGAWVHIDGAFGLWARTSPKYFHLVTGIEKADSWTVDAHKWLNVSYDSGIVIIRDSKNHYKLKTIQCSYAGQHSEEHRDGSQWVPENSRRARGFVLYAALRNLGRDGVRNIVENSCSLATEFAQQLEKLPNVHVLNNVVLNQVLFRVESESNCDTNSFNNNICEHIQKEGLAWIGTTRWQGKIAMRISVSNWLTTKADVDKTIRSIRNSIEKELQIINNSVLINKTA